jgi:hypothetical protein
MDQLIAEAKLLDRAATKLDHRTVMLEGKGKMKLEEFQGWVVRERVRQALVRAGGLPP